MYFTISLAAITWSKFSKSSPDGKLGGSPLWDPFRVQVDLGPKLPYLWRLNVPPGLKELLWKSLFNALPLGTSWRSHLSIGLDYCPCGDPAPLTLFHIFSGCSYFPICPLYSGVLFPALWSASSCMKHLSNNPIRWHQQWWFPLLAFKELAASAPDRKSRSALVRSVRPREWIYRSFLWSLWKARMKIAHESDFSLSLDDLIGSLLTQFAGAPA